MKSCPFCDRSIPDVSVFCAYCGKKIKDVEISSPNSANFETGFQKSLKRIKKQVSTFVSSLEKKVESSDSFSYVNKQRILNLLNQLQVQDKKELEGDKEELSTWAEKVEEAISGDKCIICLQEFKVKEDEKVKVTLCPSCNYAGHPNHFTTWLDTKNTCPMCRGELTKKSLLRGSLTMKEEQMMFIQD
ncbi:MAG: RING finger domain-containing protein [Candidatus Heimdallarchaeaceae archaeon]